MMHGILRYMLLLTLPMVSLQYAPAFAGNGKIKGKVVDAKTKEPLPGVNIMVQHTTIGATTNDKGHYAISAVPHGQIHLTASMIGYKTERRIIAIESDQQVTVDFELEQTAVEIGTVVVTGTATPHLVEDVPVRTEVISRLAIEQKRACNLAEALSFQTGVRVENKCQNCNFTQVRILGLDGKYSEILIDGDPVVSSLASVYGLEHFPEEMIDHIEIVKGSGSSLYGGGAVAGVINMISRRPLTNQVRLKYVGNSVHGVMDHHVGAVAETANENETSGAYVFGSFRIRSPYDYNGDGFSEIGQLYNESLGVDAYYQPLATGELMTSFHRIHEERRGGNKFDLPVHEAEIAEWVEHWRICGTLRWTHRPTPLFDYRLYYSFAVENRKSYYGGLHGNTVQDQLDALRFYGKTDNPLHLAGLQANYRLGSHLLTAGAQYTSDKLKDETAAVTAYHVDQVFTNVGFFLQDEIHFGSEEQIQLVIGTRMDKHSELRDWIFSPRVNGKFNIGGGFAVRGAYTTGFKPPQIYDEDLHLCGIEGDQRVIRNSAHLREERSYSITAGLEYRGFLNSIPAMVSLIGFRTRLDNGFMERFVSKQGVIELWERINSDGAEVKGMELDVGIRPISGVEVRSGFTYQKSEYDSPNEDFGTKNFLRTPEWTGNLRFYIDPFDRVSLTAFGNYTGKEDVPHEVVVQGQEAPELRLEKSDSFFEIDIGLTYKLLQNNGVATKLNLGVHNITDAYQKDLDKGADRDPAYVYGPARPRTIDFGLEITF
jgi:outer membrane receptor for ferrienterochelin and colicins